jgi:hypothetical protein
MLCVSDNFGPKSLVLGHKRPRKYVFLADFWAILVVFRNFRPKRIHKICSRTFDCLEAVINRYRTEQIVEGHTLGHPVKRVSRRIYLFVAGFIFLLPEVSYLFCRGKYLIWRRKYLFLLPIISK